MATAIAPTIKRTPHRFTVAEYYRMAEAGIRELWLVNLPERVLEVYREPRAAGYADFRIYRIGERVAPLAFPELELDIADLLSPGASTQELGRSRPDPNDDARP